ncbi:unnamed protein product [Caenorhabditis angaria]|uniref:USP domain-containing protein n=1 Tax=Caenorhabditis angaria TaxID=860376 RepID=A0A9P1MSE9_9PELO|nr:unnamed protein product [Caenorhabditis angaria]
MGDTFHILVLHKQIKALVAFKNVELTVDMSNLKFTITSKTTGTEEYPITLFKQYKIKSGGKYITLHALEGNEKNFSLLKFEFREGDPNMEVLAQCLNMMVEKNKAINGSNGRSNSQKSRPRLPEHRTPAPVKVEPNRACSLIRKNTANSVSSENAGQSRTSQQRSQSSQDEAKKIANSAQMRDLHPMDTIKDQSAPLYKNSTPLRPANQNIRTSLNANPNYLRFINEEQPDIPDTKPSTPKVSAAPKTPSTHKYIEYEPESPSPLAKSPQKAAALPIVSRTRLNESLMMNKFKNRKLSNIGNSCYMNATFQALSAVDYFTFRMRQTYSYIFQFRALNTEEFSEVSKKRVNLLKVSAEMLYTLTAGCPSSFGSLKIFDRIEVIERSCLREIREVIGFLNPDFDNALQQDAHEFFIIFIAELERTVKTCAKRFYRKDNGNEQVTDEVLKDNSEFRKMCPADSFAIHFEMRLICSNCGDERIREQSYQFDLNVTLRPNKNLQELIEESYPCTQNPDVKCEKCKGLGAIMSTRVSQFPETLAVNLKRYTAHKNAMKKIDLIVPVPLIIYSSKLANFQDDIMEFSEDEFKLEEVNQLEIAKPSSRPSSPPTISPIVSPTSPPPAEINNISMDETQKNSAPSTPVSTKRRSSASHRALFCSEHPEDPKDANIFDDDDLNGNSDNNNNKGKLLGGGEVKTEVSTDDLEIVEEKVFSSITFLPLSDLEEVKEKLDLVEIFDINDDTLRRHLDQFPKEKIDLKLSEIPSNCKTVDSDGNCFYRAISWLLTSTEKYHSQLRKKVGFRIFIQKN